MIAWINFAVLILSFFMTMYFYLRSAAPEAFTRLMGKSAYKRCGVWRIIAGSLMGVSITSYVVYYFYPLPGLPLPQTFPWAYWITLLIAVVITLPAVAIMTLGLIAAGKEAMIPQEKHQLYGGIYHKMRHPQAYEAFLYLSTGLLLNSPFLALFSLLGFPLIMMMVEAEERDLAFRLGEPYCEYWRKTGAYFPKK